LVQVLNFDFSFERETNGVRPEPLDVARLGLDTLLELLKVVQFEHLDDSALFGIFGLSVLSVLG